MKKLICYQVTPEMKNGNRMIRETAEKRGYRSVVMATLVFYFTLKTACDICS